MGLLLHPRGVLAILKRVTCTLAIVLAFTFASRAGLAQNSAPDLFKAKCEMCHGADGQSNTPVGKALGALPYTSPEVMKLTDPQMTEAIKNGKNKMPAFGSQLTADQIKSLLPYIHALQKKK
jgi:mono/diheme cytochrome c family protein